MSERSVHGTQFDFRLASTLRPVGERVTEPMTHFPKCCGGPVDRHRCSLPHVECPDVIKTHDVIAMRVGQQHRVQMVKTRAQCLQPELRTRIDHHVCTVVLDQQACAKTVVLWIRRSAHIALAPDHWHAMARSGPEERQTHCTCVLVIRQRST